MFTGPLRNGRAFIAALVTVLVLLIGAEVTVRTALAPDTVADWEFTDFLANERDDHGRLVAEVKAIQAAEPSSAGSIYIIGGSTIREGLVPDPIIQQALDATVDGAPTVRTLYSFDQSIAESARIALNLPLRQADTVVLGLNPRRFSFGEPSLDAEEASSRFSLLDGSVLDDLRSDERVLASLDASADGWLEALASSRLFSLSDSLALFEHRLFLRNWYEGRLSNETTQAWSDLTELRLTDVAWSSLVDLSLRDVRRPVRYAYGSTPLTDAEKAEIARTVAAVRVPEFRIHADVDAAVLAALVDALEDRGVRVAFLELPRASASTTAYGPVWDTYDAIVDRIVAASDATRIDLRSAAFGDDEYFDLEHLLAESRPRLTDLVVEAIIGVDPGLDP